jgi:hypothetical protein
MKRKRERKQTFNLIVNTREAMVRLDIHSPSNRFEKLGLVASGELRFGLWKQHVKCQALIIVSLSVLLFGLFAPVWMIRDFVKKREARSGDEAEETRFLMWEKTLVDSMNSQEYQELI